MGPPRDLGHRLLRAVVEDPGDAAGRTSRRARRCRRAWRRAFGEAQSAGDLDELGHLFLRDVVGSRLTYCRRSDNSRRKGGPVGDREAGHAANAPTDRAPSPRRPTTCVRSCWRCSATTFPCASTCWDGSTIAPTSAEPSGTLRLVSPDAVRRLLWSPNELGLARAFVAGELEVDGDIFEVVAALRAAMERGATTRLRSAGEVLTAARRLHVLGRPLPPPPEEARLHGGRHSERRDAEAISHHYDVGNDFYALVLGPSMTYSCARFVEPDTDLTTAQAAKHELVCRKLGLPERPARGCSTSGAAGARWRSMRRPTTTSRWSASRSPSRRPRRPAAGRRGRGRRPRRDPAAGLPPARRRTVRRHLLDRHGRARRAGEPRPLLRDPPRCADAHAAGCSTTPSARSAAPASGVARSSAATSSRTAS